jgi:hypothetical protein
MASSECATAANCATEPTLACSPSRGSALQGDLLLTQARRDPASLRAADHRRALRPGQPRAAATTQNLMDRRVRSRDSWLVGEAPGTPARARAQCADPLGLPGGHLRRRAPRATRALSQADQ